MQNIITQKKDIKANLSKEDEDFCSNIKSLFLKNKDYAKEELSKNSKDIGDKLETFIAKDINKNIHVYSFDTPYFTHAEASRIIAKLRDERTRHEEFVYYIQRGFELMFSHIFLLEKNLKKRPLIVKTPVNEPFEQYACHNIADIDSKINNTSICVLLRGALLPSMIISKEIQEFSSTNYITDFHLFKIKRDEQRGHDDMRYILDLDRSFFDLKKLEGKDLIFADPMNATGGSIIAILKFIERNNIKPKSIRIINIIAALEGCLNIVRGKFSFPVDVYTLWLDPVLNDKAYILPGLGDAGDRLNYPDRKDYQRNMIKLIADYGSTLTSLYERQIQEIEKVVFKR